MKTAARRGKHGYSLSHLRLSESYLITPVVLTLSVTILILRDCFQLVSHRRLRPLRPTMSESILILKACFHLISHKRLRPSWWRHWYRRWVRLFWSWKTAFGWSVTSGWNHREDATETDYEWDYFDPESLLSVDQTRSAGTIVMTPLRLTMSGPLRDSVSSRLLVIARWETCWSPRDLVSGRHPVEETDHLDLWHARHRFLWCEQ